MPRDDGRRDGHRSNPTAYHYLVKDGISSPVSVGVQQKLELLSEGMLASSSVWPPPSLQPFGGRLRQNSATQKNWWHKAEERSDANGSRILLRSAFPRGKKIRQFRPRRERKCRRIVQGKRSVFSPFEHPRGVTQASNLLLYFLP